jgi:hypothetical protein
LRSANRFDAGREVGFGVGSGLAVWVGVGAGVGVGLDVGVGLGLGLDEGVGTGVADGVATAVGGGVGTAVWTSPRRPPDGLAVTAAVVRASPPLATTNATDTRNANAKTARAPAVAGTTVRLAVTRSTGRFGPIDPRM